MSQKSDYERVFDILGHFSNTEEIADHYRDLQIKHGDRAGSRWLFRIKELRARHGVSIFEAERMALDDPIMRRWALKMMNSNQACRKAALRHIKRNGDASLIERDGFVFIYRKDADD